MSIPSEIPQPDQAGELPGDVIEFDLRALASFRDEGPSVSVLSDIGAARVVLFTFRAGQALKEHYTSSQILVQVLRGRVSFTAAGRTSAARAGTLFQVESGVRHSLVARTDAVVLVTMVPSPAQHSLESEIFQHVKPIVFRAQAGRGGLDALR